MNLIHNLTIKSVSNTADDDPNNKSLDFHTGTESVCVDLECRPRMEQWYEIAVKVKQSHGIIVITKIHFKFNRGRLWLWITIPIGSSGLQHILMSVDHITVAPKNRPNSF